jgi:MFS family permease
MPWLIAARAVQGASGGGVGALVSIVVSDLFSLRSVPTFRCVLRYGLCLGAILGRLGLLRDAIH